MYHLYIEYLFINIYDFIKYLRSEICYSMHYSAYYYNNQKVTLLYCL